MQTIQDEYRDKGVIVVMISLDEEDFLVPLYMKKHPASALMLLARADAKAIKAAYGVSGIPANFVIDAVGAVRHYSSGFGEGGEKKLRAEIEAALKFRGQARMALK